MRHTIARNAADGGYTKKFVADNVAEVGRDSTAAILRVTNFGVDTRCNSAIARNTARNIAPCIRTLSPDNFPTSSRKLSGSLGQPIFGHLALRLTSIYYSVTSVTNWAIFIQYVNLFMVQ